MLSIVIPVKNGADTLERCLQSLCNQTLKPDEIIVIDSGSEDDSIAIAKRRGATVIEIAPESFDHGLTRNLGVQHAKGDLLFLTVQDAWLPDNDTLERMVNHFKDPEVMAVTGHQAVPHEKDKNPLRWYRRVSDYKVEEREINDVEAFKKLPQHEQQKLIAWDNVVAMYRRQALIELPFVQTEMSEDWMWSYEALIKGWKLLRDSSLVVHHYHHQTPDYVFKTNWSINYHFYRFFTYTPRIPGVIKSSIKAVYHIFRNKELNFREKIYWSWHNILIFFTRWRANISFLSRLKFSGEKGIDNGYKRYCHYIPQGKQKSKPV